MTNIFRLSTLGYKVSKGIQRKYGHNPSIDMIVSYPMDALKHGCCAFLQTDLEILKILSTIFFTFRFQNL